MDGTIVSITTEQGTTVNANQTAPTIVTLADLSTVRINAQISEADVINVKAGLPVYFNVIGNPDKKFEAILKAIEPAPERISDTSSTDAAIYYVGYIEVPNTDRRFRIDMTAQVYIVVNEAKNALLIPSAALQPAGKGNGNSNSKKPNSATADSKPAKADMASNENKKPSNSVKSNDDDVTMASVRVLKADGEVIDQTVTVGINNRVNAQILSGLKQGDVVIISEEDKEKKGRPSF